MATSIMASGDVGGEAGKGMAPEEARALYDDWGDGYTTSVESWGYTMPHEIAAALASLADDAPSFSGKILDAGAGDGLSGRELRAAGFKNADITGADLSPKLLEIAASRSVYDQLKQLDLSQRLPFESESFDMVSCVGTLTYLAPSSGVLAEFVRVTKPGGHICYNLRTDHKLAWLETEKAMVANGSWQLLTETEPRPYLPNNPDYADKVLTVISCYRKTV